MGVTQKVVDDPKFPGLHCYFVDQLLHDKGKTCTPDSGKDGGCRLRIGHSAPEVGGKFVNNLPICSPE